MVDGCVSVVMMALRLAAGSRGWCCARASRRLRTVSSGPPGGRCHCEGGALLLELW